MNKVLSITMKDGNKEINLYDINYYDMSESELKDIRDSIIHQMGKSSYYRKEDKTEIKELYKQGCLCCSVMVEKGFEKEID